MPSNAEVSQRERRLKEGKKVMWCGGWERQDLQRNASRRRFMVLGRSVEEYNARYDPPLDLAPGLDQNLAWAPSFPDRSCRICSGPDHHRHGCKDGPLIKIRFLPSLIQQTRTWEQRMERCKHPDVVPLFEEMRKRRKQMEAFNANCQSGRGVEKHRQMMPSLQTRRRTSRWLCNERFDKHGGQTRI